MTSLLKTTGVGRLAALALGAVLAVSGQHAEAASVEAKGVTGGCANGIVTPDPDDAGVIDVLAGGSWKATFEDGDAGSVCFFTLQNTSSTAFAATIAAFAVVQGDDFGFNPFAGNVAVALFSPEVATNPLDTLVLLGQGAPASGTISFNIARNSSVFFDWVWGRPFGFDNGAPTIEFSVTATPVPLPAAGWLVIAGLGGLAALRRRKRAA